MIPWFMGVLPGLTLVPLVLLWYGPVPLPDVLVGAPALLCGLFLFLGSGAQVRVCPFASSAVPVEWVLLVRAVAACFLRVCMCSSVLLGPLDFLRFGTPSHLRAFIFCLAY